MSNVKSKIVMPDLSDREMELLVGALRCIEGGFPKIDTKKFAEMAGFKNSNSASVSLNLVKKKIMTETGAAKAIPKKATPSKRKQAAFEPADDDDSDESPAKKAKPTPKKAAKKAKKEESDGEGSAFI